MTTVLDIEHGRDIAGVYAEELEAIDDGYRKFGNVPFLR